MKDLGLKVSTGPYDLVKNLADKGDLSLKDVADELIKAGARQLDSLEKVAKAVGEKPYIVREEVNGFIYHCEECGQPLDPREELDTCPGCNTALNWSTVEGEGGGWGMIGIGLVGLAALLTVNALRSKNNVV